MKIGIVHYGMGNVGSVYRACVKAAPEVTVVLAHTAEQLHSCDRVVFPGQGAMPSCMKALAHSALGEAVVEALHSRPFLGICVGMQMLFSDSAEGPVAGLNWWQGHVYKIDSEKHSQHSVTTATSTIVQQQSIKVPHMGWNRVSMGDHPLWRGIAPDSYFYFVHSYAPVATDNSLVQAYCTYGQRLQVAFARDNVFATQFHPEKSHLQGLELIRHFIHWKI